EDNGVFVAVKGTKSEIGLAIGMEPHAVVAITDRQIAQKLLAELGLLTGGMKFGRKRQDSRIRTSEGTETGQQAVDRLVTPSKRRKH
ncbi:MAG: hypothetical protein OWS74_08690, partial [Firmicutes bacterium]|nr:hypothetical protein [Bacillota bacterium]